MSTQLRPIRSFSTQPKRFSLCVGSSIHFIVQLLSSNPWYLRLSLPPIWSAVKFSKRNRLTIPNIDCIFPHFNPVRFLALSVTFFKLFIFLDNSGEKLMGLSFGIPEPHTIHWAVSSRSCFSWRAVSYSLCINSRASCLDVTASYSWHSYLVHCFKMESSCSLRAVSSYISTLSAAMESVLKAGNGRLLVEDLGVLIVALRVFGDRQLCVYPMHCIRETD